LAISARGKPAPLASCSDSSEPGSLIREPLELSASANEYARIAAWLAKGARKLLPIFVLCPLIPLAIGCGSSSPGNSPHISLTQLDHGEEIWGIVKLTARVNGNDISGVKFYWDSVESAHLIAAVPQSNSKYTANLYTQDLPNGEHTLYAVATNGDGQTAQDSVRVNIANVSRAEAIPSKAIKMTPALDPHPPQLEPAFRRFWEDPVPLGPPINTAGGEDSPFITPDGQDFYFWFTPDVNIPPQNQVYDRVTGIYRSKRANGQWTEPERVFLTYYDEPSLDGAHTVWDSELWFGSARAGNYRDLDIWIAKLTDGHWSNWVNAGERLNREIEIGELHITADGTEIYFDSSRAGGKGGKDIWVTRKVNGEWQAPEPIDAVNTKDSEGWPFISEDGNELWFTRIRGAPEIWRSARIEGKWQAPEKVLSPLAGEPTLDREGNLYFVHHYWDDTANKMIEADFYMCRRK